MPTRPSFRISRIEAIPCTTVQKMIGRDDHLHQLDEAIAERPQRLPKIRREYAHENAGRHANQHLHVQMPVPRARPRRGRGGAFGHRRAYFFAGFGSRFASRSAGVTFASTPSAGTSNFASQTKAFRMVLRKSSLPQLS